MRRALRSRALAALLGATLALGGLAAAIPRVASAADEAEGIAGGAARDRERIEARAQRMRVQRRGLNAPSQQDRTERGQVIGPPTGSKLAQAITVLEHEGSCSSASWTGQPRGVHPRTRRAGPLPAHGDLDVRVAARSILSEMNRRDDVLADKVSGPANGCRGIEAEMARLRMALEFALQNLAKAREELRIGWRSRAGWSRRCMSDST
jgi:hypothetical protein